MKKVFIKKKFIKIYNRVVLCMTNFLLKVALGKVYLDGETFLSVAFSDIFTKKRCHRGHTPPNAFKILYKCIRCMHPLSGVLPVTFFSSYFYVI